MDFQNRPVLGGNNSSKIEFPRALKIKQAPFSKLGEVVEKLNEGKGQHQAALIKPGKKLDLFLMSYLSSASLPSIGGLVKRNALRRRCLQIVQGMES